MDRNISHLLRTIPRIASLSARRAWIEIPHAAYAGNTLLVALRKESVDRNDVIRPAIDVFLASLSARRAWIEIRSGGILRLCACVALRKESVDRNAKRFSNALEHLRSLSARRAWIEILIDDLESSSTRSRSPQGERG